MAGKKGKRTSRFSRKDVELWKAMTRDVRRLPERGYDDAGEDEIPSAPAPKEKVAPLPEKPAKSENLKTPRGKDVDRATAQKFARGKMRIEATLDLHGLGQAAAREELKSFISRNHARGARCVLVITGKGSLSKPGVIKSRLQEWLAEAPLASLVLKTARAQQRDGGDGAVYILLRRQRA